MASLLQDRNWHPKETYPRIDAAFYLLTRYAIRKNVWNDISPIVSEETFLTWFQSRNRLFERWCLPSVERQSMPPSRWILAFDEARREHAEPYLAPLKAVLPSIEPSWQITSGEEPEPETQSCARTILETLGSETRYVITARIDNDDAIHPDFVRLAFDYCSALAHRYPGAGDIWVTFPFGAQGMGQRVAAYIYPYNPFIVRLQTVKHFKTRRSPTCFAGNHTRIYEKATTHFAFTDEPMWLQIIHDGNLKNRSRGQRLAFEKGLELFFPQ